MKFQYFSSLDHLIPDSILVIFGEEETLMCWNNQEDLISYCWLHHIVQWLSINRVTSTNWTNTYSASLHPHHFIGPALLSFQAWSLIDSIMYQKIFSILQHFGLKCKLLMYKNSKLMMHASDVNVHFLKKHQSLQSESWIEQFWHHVYGLLILYRCCVQIQFLWGSYRSKTKLVKRRFIQISFATQTRWWWW